MPVNSYGMSSRGHWRHPDIKDLGDYVGPDHRGRGEGDLGTDQWDFHNSCTLPPI